MPLPTSIQNETPLSASAAFVEPGLQREVVRLEPMPPFRLRFRPDLWEVVEKGLEGPALVPQLSCLWLQPGSNGVLGVTKKRTLGEVAMAATKASADRGFQVLDPNLAIPAACLPRGVESGGYLRSTPCRGNNKVVGVRWHEAFVTFLPQFEGQAQEVWHMAERNRWLVWLVSQGIFGKPGEAVLARLGTQAREAYERALTVPWPQEIRADRVGRARRPLEALERAHRALTGEQVAAEPSEEPEIVKRARANGWAYADLTDTGDKNDWGEGGGRSARSGLTMAEMATFPAPRGWEEVAKSKWPWEVEGWKSKNFTPPQRPSKGGA